MDTDDPDEATAYLLAAARRAEPDATAKVQAVANLTGGTVERLDTRFKTDESIREKLDRFAKPASPFYRLARFNDALRYTIVYDESVYWARVAGTRALLSAGGYAVIDGENDWRSHYKGLNWTVQTSGGVKFEVQLHTLASLAAAEATHGLYEQQRRVKRGSRQWRELAAAQAAFWGLVPDPARPR
jgi:ppGpp synthetase/RelA/SpoT-type nucleotidyltranferase